MDDEIQVFLRGAYEFLHRHEQALDEVKIVTLALRKTIQELGPNVEQLYVKHYAAASQGEIKIAGDEVQRALAQLIQQLGESNSS